MDAQQSIEVAEGALKAEGSEVNALLLKAEDEKRKALGLVDTLKSDAEELQSKLLQVEKEKRATLDKTGQASEVMEGQWKAEGSELHMKLLQCEKEKRATISAAEQAHKQALEEALEALQV